MSGGQFTNTTAAAAEEEFDDIRGFLDSMSSEQSSAEVSSRYDLDDELCLKVPARIVGENHGPRSGGSNEKSMAGTEGWTP